MITKLSLLLFVSIILLHAQQSDEQKKLDEFVTVPRRYVVPEGLDHQQQAKVSEWVGIGREIGIATKEGLSAVAPISTYATRTSSPTIWPAISSRATITWPASPSAGTRPVIGSRRN